MMKRNVMEAVIDRMWGEHREHLRRMLIGLARDIDLAEDLLQETYLNASRGIGGYRGGDEYGWLAAIARNTFHARARRKYYGRELPLEEALLPEVDSHLGSESHIVAIHVRQAISELPENLQTALIMKHYGGFTYSEIAARLGWPQGTAQQRVWTAIHRLRVALREGEAAMESESDELRRLASALNTIEDQYKVTCIWELDEKGGVTFYGTERNPEGEPHDFNLFCMRYPESVQVRYVALNGQEVTFDRAPDNPQFDPRPGCAEYQTRLPEPIKAGEPVTQYAVLYYPDLALVSGDVDPVPEAFKDRTPGSHLLVSHHCARSGEAAVILNAAVRTPPGARILKVHPEPDETKTGTGSTFIWRRVLTPDEPVVYGVEFAL